MYFVSQFGHAKVYETSVWTPCFQILAKTMGGGGGGEQCLSQDLETGCLKLAVVKFLGVQIFKGDHIYSYFNHEHV